MFFKERKRQMERETAHKQEIANAMSMVHMEQVHQREWRHAMLNVRDRLIDAGLRDEAAEVIKDVEYLDKQHAETYRVMRRWPKR